MRGKNSDLVGESDGERLRRDLFVPEREANRDKSAGRAGVGDQSGIGGT